MTIKGTRQDDDLTGTRGRQPDLRRVRGADVDFKFVGGAGDDVLTGGFRDNVAGRFPVATDADHNGTFNSADIVIDIRHLIDPASFGQADFVA